MFKIFPATITGDGQKVPLIKDWQSLATDDPVQIKKWQEFFRERLTLWGVSCSANNLIVLDVDVKKDNGFESLKKLNLDLPLTMHQKSPSGGHHYIYRRPSNSSKYGNRVGFEPGLDIRADGGWIGYYGANSYDINSPPEWLLKEAVKGAVNASGDTIRISPSIAQAILENCLEAIREAPPGESNNVLNIESFKVGQLIASGAITRPEAEQMLFMAAKERGKPDYEARATITSGIDGGLKNPLASPFGAPVANIILPPPPGLPERWTPRSFTMEDLMNDSKLRKPQLFQDWSTEDIHILTADGGTGKTTMILSEAVHLALGERFLGFQCLNPGKTLFITGEDTAAKLGAMLGAICKQMGLFDDEVKLKKVLDSIVVKKDADLTLIAKDKQGFLNPNITAFARVMEAVQDLGPKMIVFDPISSFWGSEAAVNDMARAVGKFMGDLQEKSGACVLMINHMGKVSSGNKDMTQFAGRGGTGLPSHSRVSRVFRTIDEEEYNELTGKNLEPGVSAIMCNVNKFSDGSPLFSKPFVITRKGYLFEREILDPKKVREEAERIADTERVFKYIREVRKSGKYPTKAVVVGHFMTCGNPISEAKVKRALSMLQFSGHEGVMVTTAQGPDLSMKDSVYILTDSDGREVI